MKILLKILAFLPLWLLHGIGGLVGWLIFLGSANFRHNFLANSRQAGYSFRQVYKAVGNIGKMFAEQPKIWFAHKLPRYSFENIEILEQLRQQNQGILLLTPHLGCFEITAPAIAQHFSSFTSQLPMTVLYRPPRKKYLQNLLVTARNKACLEAVPAELSGVKRLMKVLKQRGIIGILPDQVPMHNMGEWLSFFNKPAYTMTLHAKLATMPAVAVVLVYAERLTWFRGFKIKFSLYQGGVDKQDIQQTTQNLNYAIEQLIRRLPTQYLWSYKRYKNPR